MRAPSVILLLFIAGLSNCMAECRRLTGRDEPPPSPPMNIRLDTPYVLDAVMPPPVVRPVVSGAVFTTGLANLEEFRRILRTATFAAQSASIRPAESPLIVDVEAGKGANPVFFAAWSRHILAVFDNPLGIATFLEHSLSRTEFACEGTMMLDDASVRHSCIVNTALSTGIAEDIVCSHEAIVSDACLEWKWESSCGYMLAIGERFGLGIEFRNVNAFQSGVWHYSALYAGPSAYAGFGRAFLICNVMPHLTDILDPRCAPEEVGLGRVSFRALIGVNL